MEKNNKTILKTVIISFVTLFFLVNLTAFSEKDKKIDLRNEVTTKDSGGNKLLNASSILEERATELYPQRAYETIMLLNYKKLDDEKNNFNVSEVQYDTTNDKIVYVVYK